MPVDDNAFAVRITEENFQAIASEKPNFNLEETLQWLEDHGQGYFLRHPGTSFDCEYFVDEVFTQLYAFAAADTSAIFRRVHRL
jgi:hypothetical protein